MGGEVSAASLDLSGDDLVDTTLQAMGGGLTAEASTMTPMPDVLGDESSNSEGEGTGSGDVSSSREEEVTNTECRRPVTSLVEVSVDEAEVSSLVALF